MQGGGGSPEQSQREVFARQLGEKYSQTSARQAKPRFRLQARALAFNAKGEEPVAERHPRLNPCDWTTKTPYCHPELDSGSVWSRVLSIMSARFRIKYGMTLKKIPMVCAFTMAEILLSLTIIGVVAAITLPSLTGNINERTWNTQRKALYARFSQAIALMPALNGYGTLREVSGSAGSTSIEDTAAETFVTDGLSKVLKINNICDNEHLEDCGIPSKITTLGGDVLENFISQYNTLHSFNEQFISGEIVDSSYDLHYSQINTKAVAFETVNGESVITYYNPSCQAGMNEDSTTAYFAQSKMCVNFVYDLNGSKGPNTVGKDIGFISVLYPSDSVVVAPLPLISDLGNTSQQEAYRLCREFDTESRLPNRDELAAMFYNKNLLNLEDRYYWSSSTIVWRSGGGLSGACQGMHNGNRSYGTRTNNYYVRCVKR